MDPITAFITFLTELVRLYGKQLDLLQGEEKVRYAKLFVDNMEGWQKFGQLFIPKETP